MGSSYCDISFFQSMLIGGNRAKCDVIKKLMLLNTSIPWELRKHFKSSRYRLKGQTPRAVMWRKWDSCGEKFPQQSQEPVKMQGLLMAFHCRNWSAWKQMTVAMVLKL